MVKEYSKKQRKIVDRVTMLENKVFRVPEPTSKLNTARNCTAPANLNLSQSDQSAHNRSALTQNASARSNSRKVKRPHRVSNFSPPMRIEETRSKQRALKKTNTEVSDLVFARSNDSFEQRLKDPKRKSSQSLLKKAKDGEGVLTKI